VRLLAAGAPVGTRAEWVVLASAAQGPPEDAAAGRGSLEVVAPPPPWLPRWRVPLLVSALALLAVTVAVELWWLRSHPA
jgi:hypothetical protein